MRTIKYLILFVMTFPMVSCGSFGEGILAGLSSFGNSGYYGGGYSATGFSGGNMDYLLDPAYAIAQVSFQEEQDYQEFSKYNKKADGSNYTRDDYKAMVGQAYQSTKQSSSSSSSSSYSGSSSSGYSGSSSNSSSSRKCLMQSATDIAHCNGTGICSKCNGKKKYFDSSLGLSHWVDPCVICNGTGKCPSCGGTGKR